MNPQIRPPFVADPVDDVRRLMAARHQRRERRVITAVLALGAAAIVGILLSGMI